MGEFTTLMRFEFKRTLRFPILEILAAFLLFFCLSDFGGSVSHIVEGPSPGLFESIVSKMGEILGGAMASSTPGVWLAQSLVIGGLICFSIAGDIDSGYIEYLLSYPVDRWKLLLSKLLILTLVPTLLMSVFLPFNAFLIAPDVFLRIPLSRYLIVFLVLFLQATMVCGISVAISFIAENPLSAFIASTLTFYAFSYLNPDLSRMNLYLLPPMSTSSLVQFLTLPTGPIEYLVQPLIVPLVCIIILVVAFVYFERRFQVC